MSHPLPPRRAIVLDAPAALPTDAFLLGNGELGAALRGTVGEEAFDLNVDTLWSGGPEVAGLDASRAHLLPALVDAVRAGDHAEVERLSLAFRGDRRTQAFQPLGRITWRWSGVDGRGDDGDYRRVLDLADATAEVRCGVERMRAFVSHPDDVLVADAEGSGDGAIAFTSPHPHTRLRTLEGDGFEGWIVAGRAPARAMPPSVDVPDPVVYADDEPDADGAVDAGMGWALAAVVEQHGGGRRLLVAAVTGFRGWRERPSADLEALAEQALARIERARSSATDVLRRRHVDDHRALFDRVELDLSASGDASAATAEQLFDLGRYLLVASSRPGTQPANLQGIWNDVVRPPWSCGYTLNINLGMSYWGAEAAALPEAHEPLLTMLDELVESGTRASRTFYGAPGAVVHHSTDLWRFAAPVHGDPRWAIWPMGLAWLALHLVERLEMQREPDPADVARARRVLAAVADHLLARLHRVDGALVLIPSTSPEVRFVDGEHEGAVTSGTTIDQEIAWAVLRVVADDAGVDPELARRAAAAVCELRLPQVADGLVQEWWQGYAPTDPGHRHLSHLVGASPGTRVTPSREPELWTAAAASLRERLRHGGGSTGWSQAWVLHLAARLRDGDLAVHAVRELAERHASRSLLDLHPNATSPGGVVFQIDGNLGAIAGVAELLMQSHDGCIALLPALPAAWGAGSVRGLRARGGVSVSMRWQGGRLQFASLDAGGDHAVVVELPDAGPWMLEPGSRPLAVDAEQGAVRVSVRMPAGGVANIVRMTP